jgi:hypothetical protein
MRGIDQLRSYVRLLSSNESSPITSTSTPSFIPSLPASVLAAIEIYSIPSYSRSICSGCNDIRTSLLFQECSGAIDDRRSTAPFVEIGESGGEPCQLIY